MLIRTVQIVIELEEGDSPLSGTTEQMARRALAEANKEASFWVINRVQIDSGNITAISVSARDPRAPARDNNRLVKQSVER